MRALVIILDSLGIGEAPDSAHFGDSGADTLGHILKSVPDLRLPALWSLGLGRVIGDPDAPEPSACHGRMCERSAGKDSTIGHWELAGVITDSPLGLFDHFPDELVNAVEAEARVRFIGNCPASGTQIIDELGPRHLQTGEAILYTSADSVLQIAAHEEIIPIEDLYRICRVARKHADSYRIGRVIARPFVGQPGAFKRTSNRHDFSLLPPPTILNALSDAGLPVIGVGKTGDLFAGSGLSESHPTTSNADGMKVMAERWRELSQGLIFTNLVDFDAVFGHRRDVHGYANALAEFDAWLHEFLPAVRPEDLLIITADHGNDPTYRGTDHTRERVPVLLRHGGRSDDLGERSSFIDVAATLAHAFGLRDWKIGQSMLPRARATVPNKPGQSAWPAEAAEETHKPAANPAHW